MKNVFGDFLKTGFRGIIFGSFAAVFFTGIAYALTYNWSDPSALRGKVAGNVVQSSQWNLLVGNVDNLNERLSNAEANGGTVPTGAVMAFFGSSCPTGWSPANGTTNGVKKTDGSVGTLDLRGEFIRGLDGGRWVDVWRALASAQADELRSHTHNAPYETGAGTYANGSNGTYNYLQNTWATSATGGNETRPRNVALLYCVKN